MKPRKPRKAPPRGKRLEGDIRAVAAELERRAKDHVRLAEVYLEAARVLQGCASQLGVPMKL